MGELYSHLNIIMMGLSRIAGFLTYCSVSSRTAEFS